MSYSPVISWFEELKDRMRDWELRKSYAFLYVYDGLFFSWTEISCLLADAVCCSRELASALFFYFYFYFLITAFLCCCLPLTQLSMAGRGCGGIRSCAGIILEALGEGIHGEQVVVLGLQCVCPPSSSWEILCSCSQRETPTHPVARCEPTDLPCFSKPCGYCMPPGGYRHRYDLAFQLWPLCGSEVLRPVFQMPALSGFSFNTQ